MLKVYSLLRSGVNVTRAKTMYFNVVGDLGLYGRRRCFCLAGLFAVGWLVEIA